MVDFASLANNPAPAAPAATPQMNLKWGGGGEGGPYAEKPEEKAKWKMLVNALGGEVGREVDVRVRFEKLKPDIPVFRWDTNLKKRVQKYPNSKGTKGCGLVYKTTEPGLEGLYFYEDCAQSLFATTALAKVVNACAGRKFGDEENVNPFEYVGKEFILTIALGNPLPVRDDGSHLNKGGHYWNIKGHRQVPVKATFGVQAAQAPEAQPVVESPAQAVSRVSQEIGEDDLDLNDVPF